MSYSKQFINFNLLNLIQIISLVAIGALIVSLPLQIHIFSGVANSTSTLKNSEVPTSFNVLTNQDKDKNLEDIQKNLDIQKNKIIELQFPKIVIKPIITPPPVINVAIPTVTKSKNSSDPTVQELKELISSNCAKYSCNPDQLVRVMMCESGGTNHRDTFYKGPFQFLSSTFYANAKRIDILNPDVLDARQQVQVASYMFGIGQSKQWGCK